MNILIGSQTGTVTPFCNGNCGKATSCGANCPVLECGVKFK